MIASTLSLLLLGFGAKCLVDGQRVRRNFECWQTAKPVDGVVDLSVPGRFVFPFDQTCSSAHGETVALRIPPEALLQTAVTQLLAGLKAKLEITDQARSNVVQNAESKIIWGEETLNGAIPLFGIAPFRRGAYKVTVTVIEGAPALKGVTQRLEGRYVLCGLERMPADIATAAGVVSTGIGGLVGVVVFSFMARDRRTPHPGQCASPKAVHPSRMAVRELLRGRHR